jgi:SAM-dependent methyltransferase
MQTLWLQSLIKAILANLPAEVRHRLWIISQQGLVRWPPVGSVRSESLWRLRPISRIYGLDRGQPIDRYYIERFLANHAVDVHGRVLEIADATYTQRYGGVRVTQSDVLHVEHGHPHVTMVADLTKGDGLPSETYDCILLTQTLPVIYDVHAAIRTVYRILRPGGIVLATLPGISKISQYDMERWGYYWGFTSRTARRLFGEVFPEANLAVSAHGNVLVATAFLHGLAAEELTSAELAYEDPEYEVNIAIRAQKPFK